MNEQDKNKTNHDESLKNKQGDSGAKPSSWNRMLSKRWVFPAVYTAAAAIILTLVWVYQDAGQKPLKPDTAAVVSQEAAGTGTEAGSAKDDPAALEVVASAESMVWPVASPADVEVVKPFYDEKGTEENHVAAMVQYNDTFVPNAGIDIAREDNQPFDVKAALSGEVTRVEDVPVFGKVVEITSTGNVKTVYQSLGDTKVKQGDEVKQGDMLATAGRSEIEKNLGNHVHFEVYEDGKLVNPSDLLPQR
ncbi:M23 family metallopeptidase [Paenibacillus riograndensis]|uniref:Putative stage II sporulation protein Q n=1 Tax=Paenibacillus riograndensis SBR5 TaxID=1073571 RepID=A0A0E4HED8_9BACL|nr:M23 family metallopeptidase [Paenibacillus riograndensis]CQR58656.1 putative stage II sporulation protein Q [Paenibacillus riograndensis SBR5]